MRRSLVLVVLALSAVTLAGCSSSGGASSHPESAPAVGMPQPARDMDAGGSEGPRQIITTGQLTVTVEKPSTAADEAAAIVDRSGGHVAERSERVASADEPGSARLTVRIPSQKLSATLAELKELGTPRDNSIATSDVTATTRDLDARITALQTSVDRLLDLMSKADSTQDLITIESVLSERQGNLESLQSQRRSLADQVDLSTITLNLISEKDTPADTPDTFWSGLLTGWDAFVGFAAAVLVVFGVLVPWLAAAGVLTAIVLLLLRARRRRAVANAAPVTDAAQ